MPLLFALTMFVSALLLFLVQPMIGKMVLPLLGGTPAVWNTCMVFYQALLLAGYYYAHKTAVGLPVRKQTTLHAGVMLAAFAALIIGAALTANNSPIPIVKSLSPQGDDYPFFGVIVLLTVAIGLPFFVVSTSAPLLQKWFAETGHPSSKDPYFLYAASNFGSLLALIAYPAVVEPNLRLVWQAWVWAIGYGGLLVLVFLCAKAANNPIRQVAPPPKTKKPTTVTPPAEEPAIFVPTIPNARTRRLVQYAGGVAIAIGSSLYALNRSGKLVLFPFAWLVASVIGLGLVIVSISKRASDSPPPLRQLRWVALAFVPSSLMLGVTTFVSTDMASIPLLWIIPLSLYLLTFIIVFSKVPKEVHLTATLLMPVFVLLLVFLMTSHVPAKFGLQVLLHMATFFVVAMVCHGELAQDRPSTKHLTHFYLLMSVGGMLGGLFNALAAPIVFTFTSEYPITLVAACFLLPNLFPDRQVSRSTFTWDVIAPAAIFCVCCLIQANVDELGTYLYAHGKEIVAGLVLFAIPAGIAVGLLEEDLIGRIVLAVLLGVSLILYAVIGPMIDWLQTSKVASIRNVLNAGPSGTVWRWIAIAVPVAGYAWYWQKRVSREELQRKLVVGYGALAACFAAMLLLKSTLARDVLTDMAANLNLSPRTVTQIAIYGIPAMVCYFFVERPIRFGAAVAALWLATFVTEYRESDKAFYDRSFFGRLKIEPSFKWVDISADLFPDDILEDKENYHIEVVQGEKESDIYVTPKVGDNKPAYAVKIKKSENGDRQYYYMRHEVTQLVHGTTVHGQQERNRERRDIAMALLALGAPNGIGAQMTVAGASGDALQFPGRDPQTYYHRTGPVGSMFNAVTACNRSKANPNTSAACIGLGTGTLSAYGLPGQNMVFFEIDTHVRSLVESPRFFTYIDSAKRQGVNLEFAMGDARISLERMDRKFGFMLVDAFSSDAIPAHLLTKQAFELYFQRLEEDGLLAVHISNRYLDLEPVVERICRELKLEARVMHGSGDPERDSRFWSTGKYAATWIAIAKSKEALGLIDVDAQKWLAERDASTRDRWIFLRPDNKVGLWTDDYSPIIPILRGEWRFWSKSDE